FGGRAYSRSLVDYRHPAILDQAAQLTAGLTTDREKALAIHQFVRDEIVYEFGPKFYDHTASEVLRLRKGFCNPKTTLFVALLRASRIEARIRFVEISPEILHGIVDPGTPWMDHSYAEVFLGESWVPVDSYIVDPELFAAGLRRCRAEGRRFGYGVHVEGTLDWDGETPSFSQCLPRPVEPSLRRNDYGVFPDVVQFYEMTPEAWNRIRGKGMRTFFRLAAVTFNDRIRDLRAEETGGLPRSRIPGKRMITR
ncbi:MAG: transglutaminase-like domain-containing protein, partial [Verrucomicrobiota bacterium]